jgi:hypothetical protein
VTVTERRRYARPVWLALAATAVLWPSRFIGPLDGIPLDGKSEALVIGLALPALWWLTRGRPLSSAARAAIVGLIVWKAATGVAAQQQGLCARTTMTGPLSGTAMTMRIEEPHGFLRSWDVRADLWAEQPACTAILTRPVRTLQDFPAWFVNVTDQIVGKRDFTIDIRGFATESGQVVPITQSIAVTGEALHYEPDVNGEPLFGSALTTVDRPGAIDRALGAWAWLVSPLLCAALVSSLALAVVRRFRGELALWLWVAAASIVAVLLAQPAAGTWSRLAGLVALGAAAIPVHARARNLTGAFLLLGIPWLAFFAARSFDQIGRFSIFSTDDWLAYQAAGYRIYVNGFWIEGGTPTFDYQPLYRWITGFLHLLFGDSSVGELYWDAACLLIGALLAFQLVRATAGFRWGLVAGGATLATFLVGTPWYFVGRGLSEIAAAGFAFLAMLFLLRAKIGGMRWVAAATAMAILMFLSRLNHLLWVALLPAMLISLRVPASWRAIAGALPAPRALALYATGFIAALLLFMTRTWYYTGDFSLFQGTSLRHNDTGLRPWTLLDGEAWSRVAHSLAAFAWMNEPPRPDPRAIVMAAGVVIGAAAVFQVPIARRLPAALVLAAAGAAAGAFFAHAHGYPGRFSIHAVPLASALVFTTAARGFRA